MKLWYTGLYAYFRFWTLFIILVAVNTIFLHFLNMLMSLIMRSPHPTNHLLFNILEVFFSRYSSHQWNITRMSVSAKFVFLFTIELSHKHQYKLNCEIVVHRIINIFSFLEIIYNSCCSQTHFLLSRTSHFITQQVEFGKFCP